MEPQEQAQNCDPGRAHQTSKIDQKIFQLMRSPMFFFFSVSNCSAKGKAFLQLFDVLPPARSFFRPLEWGSRVSTPVYLYWGQGTRFLEIALPYFTRNTWIASLVIFHKALTVFYVLRREEPVNTNHLSILGAWVTKHMVFTLISTFTAVFVPGTGKHHSLTLETLVC